MQSTLFVVLFVLCAISSVLAVGVSPPRVFIEPIPGDSGQFNITVQHTAGQDVYMHFDIYGTYEEVFSIAEDKVFIPGPSGSARVTINYTLPQEFTKYGRTLTYFQAIEAYQATAGASARTGAKVQMFIDVPYPGNYAEFGFDMPNAKVGFDANVTLRVYNRGSFPLSDSRAVLTVTDFQGQTVYSTTVANILLEPAGADEFLIVIPSHTFLPGNYNMSVVFQYGDNGDIVSRSAWKKFVVGELDVDLYDYQNVTLIDKISRLNVELESLWTEMISDVSVKVRIDDRWSDSSPAIDLPGLHRKSTYVYVDTTDLKQGMYEGEILASFAGATKSFPAEFLLTTEEPTKESILSNWLVLVLVVNFLFLAVVVIAFLRMRKK